VFRWNYLRPRCVHVHPLYLVTEMAIYLFRVGGSRTFAYSLDVTGRNLPPAAEGAKWLYERTVDAKQLKAHPEAEQELRASGFHLFNGFRQSA
jgi:hypothetical protein